MPYDPSEYGQQPMPYEQDGTSGHGLDGMAEAMRLASQMPQTQYMPVPAAPPQYQQPQRQFVAPPNEMYSIDRRLRKAQYYRALMEGSMFDQGDELALEVEREMKEYVVIRMKSLVGEDPATAASAKLTDEEIKYLKLWAQTLKAKAEGQRNAPPAPPAPPATPTVRAAAVPPPQPVAAPAPPAPAAPAAPSVRRRRASMAASPGTMDAPPPPAAAPTPAAPAPRPPARGRAGKYKPTGIQPLPMPSGHAMEAVMATKAMQEASQATVVETNPLAKR